MIEELRRRYQAYWRKDPVGALLSLIIGVVVTTIIAWLLWSMIYYALGKLMSIIIPVGAIAAVYVVHRFLMKKPR